MTSELSISFIVPTLNSAESLRICLESIYSQNYSKELIEIIVVDNGSNDETENIANEYTKHFYCLETAKVTGLRNFGANKSSGDILAFIDSDCEIDVEWTNTVIKLLSEDVVAAGSPMLFSMQVSFIGDLINNQSIVLNENQFCSWVPSAALAIKREIFESIGGFDSNLLTCEDVDIGYQLDAAGYKLIASMDLTPKHYGDPKGVFGLIKKEFWRGTDSLVIWCKYKHKIRETLSNLYQLWFHICLITFVLALITNSFAVALMMLGLFFLPVLVFTLRSYLVDRRRSLKNLLSYYLIYYIARSLSFSRGICRVFQYYSDSRLT